MRTFTVLNGLSVISLANGEEIGKIIDLLFDGTEVKGIIIDKNGLLNRHLYVPLQLVESIGQDALMVKDLHKLPVYDKKRFPYHSLQHGTKHLLGKPLMSKEGETIGLVEDVYFHEKLGNIVGYEVTDGLIADIKEGKQVVKTNAPLTIGEEMVVIDLNS